MLILFFSGLLSGNGIAQINEVTLLGASLVLRKITISWVCHLDKLVFKPTRHPSFGRRSEYWALVNAREVTASSALQQAVFGIPI